MRRYVVVVVLLATVSACGGDDDDDDAMSSVTTAPTETTVPTETTTTVAGEAVAKQRVAVFIDSVDIGTRAVTYDEINFLTGAEAEEAYAAENPEDPLGPPNDYFITNPETALITAPVADDVAVQLVKLSDDEDADLDAATFEELDGYGFPTTPYWITLGSGAITAIEEQYVP